MKGCRGDGYWADRRGGRAAQGPEVVSQAPVDRGCEHAGSCGYSIRSTVSYMGTSAATSAQPDGPDLDLSQRALRSLSYREYRPLPASAGDDPPLRLFRADSLAAARRGRHPVAEHPHESICSAAGRTRGPRGAHRGGSPGLCRGSSPGTDHLRAADTNGPGPGYVRDALANSVATFCLLGVLLTYWWILGVPRRVTDDVGTQEVVAQEV